MLGSGPEPHREGWGRTARAGSKSPKKKSALIATLKCPDRMVRPMKPVPEGDRRGRHAEVGWHS